MVVGLQQDLLYTLSTSFLKFGSSSPNPRTSRPQPVVPGYRGRRSHFGPGSRGECKQGEEPTLPFRRLGRPSSSLPEVRSQYASQIPRVRTELPLRLCLLSDLLPSMHKLNPSHQIENSVSFFSSLVRISGTLELLSPAQAAIPVTPLAKSSFSPSISGSSEIPSAVWQPAQDVSECQEADKLSCSSEGSSPVLQTAIHAYIVRCGGAKGSVVSGRNCSPSRS